VTSQGEAFGSGGKVDPSIGTCKKMQQKTAKIALFSYKMAVFIPKM
jgi:hypothetical protein